MLCESLKIGNTFYPEKLRVEVRIKPIFFFFLSFFTSGPIGLSHWRHRVTKRDFFLFWAGGQTINKHGRFAVFLTSIATVRLSRTVLNIASLTNHMEMDLSKLLSCRNKSFDDFLPSLSSRSSSEALAPPVSRQPLSPFSLISPLMSWDSSQHLVSGNMTYLYRS